MPHGGFSSVQCALTNETTARMKVSTLIRKIEAGFQKIRTVGSQQQVFLELSSWLKKKQNNKASLTWRLYSTSAGTAGEPYVSDRQYIIEDGVTTPRVVPSSSEFEDLQAFSAGVRSE